VQDPCEDKGDDVNPSSYEKRKRVFVSFLGTT
jgi:hypothetical protein